MGSRGVALSTCMICVLWGCTNTPRGHGDHDGTLMDGGNDGSTGRDGEDGLALDAGGDAGPGDAAVRRPEVHARRDSAVGPAHFALSSSTLSVSRCGVRAVDVEWEGQGGRASDVQVGELPYGVTATVSAVAEQGARVLLSATADAAVGTSHVEIAYGSAEGLWSGAVELTVAETFDVHLLVQDAKGAGMVGHDVVVNGATSAAVVTDSRGRVTIPSVAVPYDLFVAFDTTAVDYHGLTRCDPILTPPAPHAENLEATGTVSLMDGFAFSAGEIVVLGSANLEPGASSLPADAASTTSLSFAGRVYGASPLVPLHALWIGAGPSYKGTGSGSLAQQAGSAVLAFSISIGGAELPSRAHTVTLTPNAGYAAGTAQLALLASDVPGGRMDALPVRSTRLGAFTGGVATPSDLATRIPSGGAVLALSSSDGARGRALVLTSAAEGDSTKVAFPETAYLSDLAISGLANAHDAAVTMSWTAVPGAKAIVVDLGNARAVLPGSATSYDTGLAQGVLDTFGCRISVSAILAEGYDPNIDADGTGLVVPSDEKTLDGKGPGRFLGRRDTVQIYSWVDDTCT